MRFIKRFFKMLRGSFKFLRNYFDVRMIRRTVYSLYYKYLHVKKNVILYESFYGRGMLCGPYALFLEAVSDERFKDFKHVWVIDDAAELKRVKALYRDHKNVSFVAFKKLKYVKMLATAGYLINNSTFPDYYIKREGQVYVNTWHGIPLKNMGYDMPDGVIQSANVVRNFLKCDYITSASRFFTDTMLKSAYKLDGLYDGKIIEEGYPRLDLFSRLSKEEVLRKLTDLGVKTEPGKKIILYAPTWRGKDFKNADSDISGYVDFKNRLEKLIDKDKYQILIKPHQRVFQLAGEDMIEPYFVPANIDANEVLSVTDILVSDFSSIFYDYLALERPVLFFIEDASEYKEQRGTYHTLDHLPGPVSETIEALASDINDISTVKEKWSAKFKEVKEYANACVKSGISKKILDIVFFGKEEGYDIVKCDRTKPKILIVRGKMLVNGITTAFINLLDNIAYDRYDITVMIQKCFSDNSDALYKKINPNARVLYKNSPFNMTLFENIFHRLRLRFSIIRPFRPEYNREWYRDYGDSEFDAIVDFEGYNAFNMLTEIQRTDIPKAVWLHNDMMNERKVRFDWLINVFKLYRYFDRVVACGEEIMKVNREKMCEKYIDSGKLTFADNMIDFGRVLEMSGDENLAETDGKTCYLVRPEYDVEVTDKKGRSEIQHYDTEYMEYVPEFGDDNVRNIRFVNTARLSPEKNQATLIRAFKRFYDDHKNAYLYILGNGVLKEELEKLVEELGLLGHVFIPGFVTNPYVVMKNSDCFILPSLHEGQPVVVHEARVLKLPIIVSDFSSEKGIEIENGQLLIGHSEDDIYEGLKAFAEGKVPAGYEYDYEEFNKKAVSQFYNLVDEMVTA